MRRVLSVVQLAIRHNESHWTSGVPTCHFTSIKCWEFIAYDLYNLYIYIYIYICHRKTYVTSHIYRLDGMTFFTCAFFKLFVNFSSWNYLVVHPGAGFGQNSIKPSHQPDRRTRSIGRWISVFPFQSGDTQDQWRDRWVSMEKWWWWKITREKRLVWVIHKRYVERKQHGVNSE